MSCRAGIRGNSTYSCTRRVPLLAAVFSCLLFLYIPPQVAASEKWVIEVPTDVEYVVAWCLIHGRKYYHACPRSGSFQQCLTEMNTPPRLPPQFVKFELAHPLFDDENTNTMQVLRWGDKLVLVHTLYATDQDHDAEPYHALEFSALLRAGKGSSAKLYCECSQRFEHKLVFDREAFEKSKVDEADGVSLYDLLIAEAPQGNLLPEDLAQPPPLCNTHFKFCWMHVPLKYGRSLPLRAYKPGPKILEVGLRQIGSDDTLLFSTWWHTHENWWKKIMERMPGQPIDCTHHFSTPLVLIWPKSSMLAKLTLSVVVEGASGVHHVKLLKRGGGFIYKYPQMRGRPKSQRLHAPREFFQQYQRYVREEPAEKEEEETDGRK